MLKKVIRFLFIPIGGGLGAGVAALILMLMRLYQVSLNITMEILLYAACIVTLSIIGWFVGAYAGGFIYSCMQKTETKFRSMPIKDVILWICGLLIGFIIAFLVGQTLTPLTNGAMLISINIILYIVFGWLGVRIALSRREEIKFSFTRKRRKKKQLDDDEADDDESPLYDTPKLLDASILIDGRLPDICRTGFISGTLIVPQFVLDEIRRIADSEDAAKRGKGRRGLDVLKRLQDECTVILDETAYEGDNADVKLITRAKELEAPIITTDYNLNMLASVHGISILNINDLANVLKPALVAGEAFSVKITKEGKDPTQGVGYLDDGTMIVIENGADAIGQTVETVVTSVLQTSAGKIIFAKIK